MAIERLGNGLLEIGSRPGVFGRFDQVIAARRALQQVFGSATI